MQIGDVAGFGNPSGIAEGVHRVQVAMGQQFVDTLRAVVGKRVTYKSLTGKDMLPATT